MQSICSETETGVFSKYPFQTIDCNGLEVSDIYPRGFFENIYFWVNWYPSARETNTWEIAMLPVGEAPNADNSIIVNRTGHGFTDIDLDKDYVFHIRRKCNDFFGDWVEKPILLNEFPNEFSNDCTFDEFTIYDHSAGDFSISWVGEMSDLLLVETGEELSTGVVLDPYGHSNHSSYHVSMDYHNPSAIFNEYSALRPRTSYDFYGRIKCGLKYSEYILLANITTPIANSAVIWSLSINENTVVVDWSKFEYYHGWKHCQPYLNTRYQIEYGMAGLRRRRRNHH